jgi:Domain of unknown function (DUF1772)
MLVGQRALVFAAAFAGAAIYINIAEQPARLGLPDQSLLNEWKPSYQRAHAMQAPLALASGLLGAAACYLSMDWRWLIGTVFIIANWPYTFAFIMSTNKELLAIANDKADRSSRALIEKWGRLHAVRSAFGVAATVAYLWALN